MHKKKITNKHLKALNASEVESLNTILLFSNKQGQKLCYHCFDNFSFQKEQHSDSKFPDPDAAADDSYYDRDTLMYNLNAGIIELGCSPLCFGRASERDKATYGRRKVEQIHLEGNKNISRLFALSQDDISIPPIHRPTCEKCDDEILSSFKEKLKTSSKTMYPVLNPDTYLEYSENNSLSRSYQLHG